MRETDWIARLSDVISYIEDNLAGEISYEKAARIACCSADGFQRMFSYIAGKPLSEYIRCRRLTVAAMEILSGNERIIDVALKYGYDSQDAFSRAFRAFHGILPSKARMGGAMLKSCPKLSFRITVKGADDMDYKVENWNAFSIMGVKTVMDTDEAFERVPALWDSAWKNGLMKQIADNFPDYRPAGYIGAAFSGGDKTTEYVIGAVNHVDIGGCKRVAPPEGLEEFTVPAGKWVIITANGKIPDCIQNVYRDFYSEWLPKSGFRLANLPVIECYMQEERQEVWIGVE
ncbi:MAG: AraC family transcriptional regulator [Eubacteriales bacterium]|nr:AraC family transcriptional regulator [Eubacteriales bacterium]MDD3880669.1 AraC family transcriptional regulator [Eubacteriales bacterium]MDD4511697.1 AraC family transcriptional regulator [Eubacteriales bacterium]